MSDKPWDMTQQEEANERDWGNGDGQQVATIQLQISPEVRAYMIAANEAGKRQEEEEAAAAAAVKPFTVAAIVEYMREWANLRSVNKIGHDDQFHYFNAKAMHGREYLQIRVAKIGYIVDGTYFTDIETRAIEDDYWQCLDSVSRDLTSETA